MNIPEGKADRHNWETMTPLVACVIASWVVDRAEEVRKVLEADLNWRPDRQLSLRTLLIGMQMLGMLGRRRHHRQVRLALRSLPFPVQRALNVVDGRGRVVSYRQIEKAVVQIAKILAEPTLLVDHDHPLADTETGEVIPCPPRCPYMVADHNWFMTGLAHASMPADIPRALDMSMDSTDMQTWAKQLYRFSPEPSGMPGDVGSDYHSEALSGAGRPPEPARPTSAIAPLGPDGRPVPTKDADARWGHRSRRSGISQFFVGWDNHTLLGVPDRDGSPYAPFLTASVLVPAVSYSADAAITLLRTARYFNTEVRDLIADRGYTRLDPDRFRRPALELVDNIVLDLVETQQTRKVDYTIVRDEGKPNERTIRIKRIAGGFFASSLPDELDGLTRPNIGATRAAREENMAEFDKRAQYAFVRHGHSDAGSQRWAGPATSYAKFKVRCPNNGASMRAPHERPLTRCAEGVPCSCGEVVVIDDPDSEREQQRHLWGTTKWTESYNRRTVVERGYADDKVQVTQFDRDSVYCFGTVKHAIYYSPTIVARNIQVALRWYLAHEMADPWGIDAMSRADYRLPAELGGVHAVEAEPAPPADGEPQAEEADPEDSGADEDEEPTALAGNRKQRRAADRRTRSRRPPARPPKPPPRPSGSAK